MHRYWSTYITLFLFNFICVPAITTAQPAYIFNTKKLTVKNGLIHQEVNTIFQDSRGLIWMGTRFGLSRYDGYEFRSFTCEKDKLSDNSIEFIYEDDRRQLWLFYTTQRRRKDKTTAIDILNTEEGTVSNISAVIKKLPFEVKKIKTYFTSPQKELFIYADNGLWKYEPQNGFVPASLQAGFVPFACWGKDKYWGIFQQEYARTSPGKLERFGPASPQEFPGTTGAGNQYLYIASRTAPYLRWAEYAPLSIMAHPGINSGKDAPAMVHYDDIRKLLWISRGRELLALDDAGNTVFSLANTRDEPVERFITGLITDRNGVAWVATQGGVVLVELKPQLFSRYLYTVPGEDVTKQVFYQCRGILTYDHFALINTYRGGFRVNVETGKADSIAELLQQNGSKLPNRFPVYQDASGRFYSGANVLIELDPNTGKELRIIPGVGKRIWSLFRDTHGDMLIGTADGLFIAGKDTDSAMPFTRLNQFTELAQANIIQILTDKQGITWLVTNTGLFTYDKEKGITSHYHAEGTGKFKIPANNIQHLYIDKDDLCWMATEGSGLIKWNREIGAAQVFTRSDGLSSNNIYSVYEDRDGYLWMSSDYGIMRMHKTNGQVNTYTTDDGLSHYEFNRIAHHQSADGQLFFGGLNGVTAFYPEKLNEISFTAATGVTIAELQQYAGNSGNLEDYTGRLLRNGRIVLRPSDKFFLLKLASPEYIHSDKTVFFYKIEGLDKEWIRTTSNSIRIGRLPYGKYTLVIKAQAGNGSTTPETRIPIVVIRPFYLRWWFFVLVALAVILCVSYYYRWRIRQLKNRKKELEMTVAARTQELQKDKATILQQAEELMQLDEMKSKFFANVSHELRTPLTLLAGPVNRLMQQTGKNSEDHAYLALMQQNVQQLQNRVNEILDLSKLDAGKLTLQEKPVRLETLMQPLIASFDSLAQQKKISFLYRNRMAENQYLLLDAEHLKKIMNNLLSNAFKFTPAGGQVLVTITENIGQVIIKVSDTGEGIHPDEQEYVFNRFYQSKKGSASIQGGTGIGLALTSELIALMKGKIILESELGKGSTFLVEMPKKLVAAPKEPPVEEIVIEKKEPAAAQPFSGSKIKGASVLLVEDNLSLQQYIRMELKDFDLTVAGNGAEAMLLLNESKTLPQLVISDVMMPIMDGFTLLEKMKADERFRKIPVIMLTARTDIQDRLHALRIGVDDYLVKPFVTEELVARVYNLLERYNARNNSQWVQEEEGGDAVAEQEETTIQKPSSAWLKTLEDTVNDFLDRQVPFTLDMLAEKINISKRQLQRNIKEETGLNANNYIKEIRLYRARHYLENKTFTTVTEISHSVGFNDPHYFSSQFSERYGKKPSDYFV